MTCCLCGTKPFPEPVWIRLHLDPCKLYVLLRTITTTLPGNWYQVQYITRNMHTVFALLCFVVVIHWLIFPYPSGLLHWHCGNLTIAPVPAKQLWWIWINTSCEFIMNDYITTTKQSTTKPCAYFLGYTVSQLNNITVTSQEVYDISNHCLVSPLFRLITKYQYKHVNHFEDG